MCFKKLFREGRCHKEGWHGWWGTFQSPQALFTTMKCVCVKYFCSYYDFIYSGKNKRKYILCFLKVTVTLTHLFQNIDFPREWGMQTSWHSIVHTRKHEERGNHSLNNTAWLQQNDLEEPVGQLQNKHSETATICSNSLSLLKSDLQEADTLLDNTPPSVSHLKPCEDTQTSWKWEWCKISGELRKRKAQEGNLDSIHHHWTLNCSKEMWCSKTKQKNWIKFLPEKNSKDKLHRFFQVH